MQAITTKYLPTTETKPSRVKASCERGSITLSWDHEYNVEDMHRHAAHLLCESFAKEDAQEYGTEWEKSHWLARLITGETKNNYVHVFFN